MSELPQGSTIGIHGGGQLGRMLSVAASRLGYRCHIFEPGAAPAGDVALTVTTASYEDEAALRAFAASVDVITYEFELVPTSALDLLESLKPIRPNRRALAISQGDPSVFFTHPISATLLALTVLLVIVPWLVGVVRARRGR